MTRWLGLYEHKKTVFNNNYLVFSLFMRHLHNITKHITATWNIIHKCEQILFISSRHKFTIEGKPLILCLLGNIVSKEF